MRMHVANHEIDGSQRFSNSLHLPIFPTLWHEVTNHMRRDVATFGKTVEIQSRSASVSAIFIRMRSRRLSCLGDIYAARCHQKSVYVRISPCFRGFISRFHIVAHDFLPMDSSYLLKTFQTSCSGELGSFGWMKVFLLFSRFMLKKYWND